MGLILAALSWEDLSCLLPIQEVCSRKAAQASLGALDSVVFLGSTLVFSSAHVGSQYIA